MSFVTPASLYYSYGTLNVRGHRGITHSQDVAAGIEVRGLTKSFGRAGVLRKLDLDVRPGEVLTVLGPNGSGKTTLINIIATLTKADAGSVRVGGLDIDRRGAAARPQADSEER